MKDIVLVGFGGHAKGIIDTIERQGEYNIVGFTDLATARGKSYKTYRVIGQDSDLEKINKDGVLYAFVTLGYMGDSLVREGLYQKLKKIGYQLPVIIDETAAVAEDVQIGEGTFVGKNAVVNADTVIGKMCIINDGAIIEHDCNVGDYSHVAVGAVVCGEVKLGEWSFVGANSTVIQGLMVGNAVKVGAGSVVLGNVDNNCTVYGVWKRD